MNRILFNITFLLFGFIFWSFGNVANAQTGEYLFDQVNVDIQVNDNASMIIEEELVYRFNGSFRGIYREFTLTNEDNLEYCRQNAGAQCGGFDSMRVLELIDNEGNIVPANAYTLNEIEDEESSEKRLELRWQFSENPRQFNNEQYKVKIRYEVINGLGFFDEYDLFYWNVLFPDRTVEVLESNINIKLPGKINFDQNNFKVLSGYQLPITYSYEEISNTLRIKVSNIPPQEDVTVIWALPKDLLKPPGNIKLIERWVPFDPVYYVNGARFNVNNSKINNVPYGETTLKIERSGYNTQVENFYLMPGESKTIQVDLSPTLLMQLIIWGLIILNIGALIILPFGIIKIVMNWYNKGRDYENNKSIYPIFDAPENIPPYLVGALKDESVDNVDITSVIIDAAYKGYLKIVQIKKPGIFDKAGEYEFIKLKPFDDYDVLGKKILDAIFDYKDRVTTESLKDSLYLKIEAIKPDIYEELVNKKYFRTRPDNVRKQNLGTGILLIIFGIILAVFGSVLTISLTGFFLGTIFIGLTITVLGIVLAMFAKFMPAKTKDGSDMLKQVLGLRMFIHHAERFRLEKQLTSDTFEKLLSYALVFGIASQWAENFKDLYNGIQPQWYEGSGTFNPIFFSNSMNNMMTQVSAAPASESSSGSGFSSGGGFGGGFSGGGGGGGGGGAF